MRKMELLREGFLDTKGDNSACVAFRTEWEAALLDDVCGCWTMRYVVNFLDYYLTLNYVIWGNNKYNTSLCRLSEEQASVCNEKIVKKKINDDDADDGDDNY